MFQPKFALQSFCQSWRSMTWKESIERAKGELVVLTAGFYSLEGTKDLLKGFYLLILIYDPCYYPPVLLAIVMTGIIKSHSSKHTDSWQEMTMTFVPSCHIISLFFLLLFKALDTGSLWPKEVVSRSSPIATEGRWELRSVSLWRRKQKLLSLTCAV